MAGNQSVANTKARPHVSSSSIRVSKVKKKKGGPNTVGAPQEERDMIGA